MTRKTTTTRTKRTAKRAKGTAANDVPRSRVAGRAKAPWAQISNSEAFARAFEVVRSSQVTLDQLVLDTHGMQVYMDCSDDFPELKKIQTGHIDLRGAFETIADFFEQVGAMLARRGGR